VQAIKDEMEEMRKAKDSVISKMVASVEEQRRNFESRIDRLNQQLVLAR